MSKTKQISVTLPEDLIETIRSAVERGEARSVSAFIASRLAPGMMMDSLFSEWDAERGAPGPEDRAWARQELDRVFTEQDERNHTHNAA